MSDRQHFCWVPDPRNPDADECLGVYFQISSFGTHPHGYAEGFDPGSDPEFEIRRAQTEAGERVDLTEELVEAFEASVSERFNFSEAKRDERDHDLYLLEGVL